MYRQPKARQNGPGGCSLLCVFISQGTGRKGVRKGVACWGLSVGLFSQNYLHSEKMTGRRLEGLSVCTRQKSVLYPGLRIVSE